MTKIAFIFPGQGSQSVGMGKQLIENDAKSNQFYEQADQVLGFSISDIMLNGPAEELTKTYQCSTCTTNDEFNDCEQINRSRHYSRLYSWSQS